MTFSAFFLTESIIRLWNPLRWDVSEADLSKDL